MILIIEHFLKGTYTKDSVEKEDVIAKSKRDCDWVINLENMTYFDDKKNEWIKIEHK